MESKDMATEFKSFLMAVKPKYWSYRPPWAYWDNWERAPGAINILLATTDLKVHSPVTLVSKVLSMPVTVNHILRINDTEIVYKGQKCGLGDSTLMMPPEEFLVKVVRANKNILDRVILPSSWKMPHV